MRKMILDMGLCASVWCLGAFQLKRADGSPQNSFFWKQALNAPISYERSINGVREYEISTETNINVSSPVNLSD